MTWSFSCHAFHRLASSLGVATFILAALFFPAQAQPFPFASSSSTATSSGAPHGPTELAVDDGFAENAIFTPDGGEFVWMNVLTPPSGLCPYRVESIRVLWPDETRVAVGDTADIYLYTDADGDLSPATGTVFRTKLEDVIVQFNDEVTFSEYNLPTPLEVQGCADLVVALVNTGMTGPFKEPGALDTTTPQERSWVGLYDGPVPRPPPLPAPIFGQIGDLAPGDGNFTIRAVASPLSTAAEDGASTPRFILGPAFPNPTRDEATVRFRLDEPTHVCLVLYDALGRTTTTIVDGTRGAGEHRVVIETANLEAGLYVWRLSVGSESETGKLTVME